MNYEDFLANKEQIEKLPVEEQKKFYERLLKSKYDKTKIRVCASFCYGKLFYQEGDFRKTIEIMEPVVVNYQSYPYIPQILSCFNLMGVATHCEAEFRVSRFFYETALEIAKEHDEKFYYAFEYNNIALSYIAERNYTAALKNLELAQAEMKDCDAEMGAYIYVNKSISFQKLNRPAKALEAFETAVNQYHAEQIIPDDVVRCAATLYYRMAQTEQYEIYKQLLLQKMDDMYAAEFMDACRELFECGMDSADDALMLNILNRMSQYMEKYPKEIKVGLAFAELEYLYAVRKGDKDAVLHALEEKSGYQERIIAYAMNHRVKFLNQCIETNSQISELERDALTGFKNRTAYYRELDIMKRDEDISRQPVGVVFVDVNGLKRVNDSWGHEAGDKLIVATSQKITAAFPEAKWYRFGGDEFVLLSFDKNEASFAAKVNSLSASWTDECSASIGTVWLKHAEDTENGVSAADRKMYQNKNDYYAEKQGIKPELYCYD